MYYKSTPNLKIMFSPELRSLLPEVRARQLPLAKLAYADSIMEQLKGRFQKETKPTPDELHHEKMVSFV